MNMEIGPTGNQIKYIGNVRYEIVSGGDVRTEPAEALITAINSEGAWFGGIDTVIQRAAAMTFHNQAAAAMPLMDLQTVVARAGVIPGFSVSVVIFVVDDLQSKLREVIKAGLRAASDNGFKVVMLPGIRMGVMLGVVEKSLQEAYDELDAGITEYIAENPNTALRYIKLVIRD